MLACKVHVFDQLCRLRETCEPFGGVFSCSDRFVSEADQDPVRLGLGSKVTTTESRLGEVRVIARSLGPPAKWYRAALSVVPRLGP